MSFVLPARSSSLNYFLSPASLLSSQLMFCLVISLSGWETVEFHILYLVTNGAALRDPGLSLMHSGAPGGVLHVYHCAMSYMYVLHVYHCAMSYMYVLHVYHCAMSYMFSTVHCSGSTLKSGHLTVEYSEGD